MDLFIEQKQTHRLREQTYGWGEGWVEEIEGLERTCTHCYI